jgi:hypothetical protein
VEAEQGVSRHGHVQIPFEDPCEDASVEDTKGALGKPVEDARDPRDRIAQSHNRTIAQSHNRTLRYTKYPAGIIRFSLGKGPGLGKSHCSLAGMGEGRGWEHQGRDYLTT